MRSAISSRRGFSLTEVALALGIASFAFVSLLTLVPLGLDHFRMALATSTRAQIVQRVVGDAQETDYDVLLTAGGFTRYFDEEGFETTGLAGSLYTVSLTALPTTVLPGAAPSASILTLQVRVADNPAGVADPFATTSHAVVNTYTAYVSRNR
jgi:uncharacterized protein (TIGR02598 family)